MVYWMEEINMDDWFVALNVIGIIVVLFVCIMMFVGKAMGY
jgi:hypothetical protein